MLFVLLFLSSALCLTKSITVIRSPCRSEVSASFVHNSCVFKALVLCSPRYTWQHSSPLFLSVELECSINRAIDSVFRSCWLWSCPSFQFLLLSSAAEKHNKRLQRWFPNGSDQSGIKRHQRNVFVHFSLILTTVHKLRRNQWEPIFETFVFSLWLPWEIVSMSVMMSVHLHSATFSTLVLSPSVWLGSFNCYIMITSAAAAPFCARLLQYRV